MLKRLMMILAAATLVGEVSVTAAQAQRGGGHGGGLGGGHIGTMGGGSVGIGMGHAGIRGAGPRIRTPNMQSRIPAPLPAPPQPPVINGPMSPSGLPAMGNGL